LVRVVKRSFCATLPLAVMVLLCACGATAEIVIPTERPTDTPTFTPSASPTLPNDATFTPTFTATRALPTGGPSPTPLFGPSRTPGPNDATPTRVVNPNAPRIEFFTSDVLAVEPGGSVTLYWSVRGGENGYIYRLDAQGQRTQIWNVGPYGNVAVRTRQSERGELRFQLIFGSGADEVQESLVIPLQCPVVWFFQPGPEDCPNDEAVPTRIIEQPFERGRMLYLTESNRVYALFNDGSEPAWVAFENRYDPTVHPLLDESFVPPPGLFQPSAILGFVWRGNDTVRNRLGLGTQEEFVFEGFLQTVNRPSGDQDLFVSSADGTVIEILPDGEGWQILAPG
jgi:hypothetical protein